jgi:hypothetical protein
MEKQDTMKVPAMNRFQSCVGRLRDAAATANRINQLVSDHLDGQGAEREETRARMTAEELSEWRGRNQPACGPRPRTPVPFFEGEI